MITNLAQFNAGIDKWISDMEDLATGTLRGLAVEAFTYIVHGTPQWSGGLASNWRLTVGSPAVGYSPSFWKQEMEFGGMAINREPYSRAAPNTAAVHLAVATARTQMQFARLGAPIYITNTAPYAVDVQNDIVGYQRKSRVRMPNRPILMVDAAIDKFHGIGSISAARAYRYSKATPG